MPDADGYLLTEKLGLDRVEAAAYIGVSPTLFDAMVADGRAPQPKTINARVLWDRIALDQAFHALPNRAGKGNSAQAGGENPWEGRRTGMRSVG